jgi:hypothetical protein
VDPSTWRATPVPGASALLLERRLVGLFTLGLAAALGQAACGFPEYGGFAAEGQGGAGTTTTTGGSGGQGACAAGFAHCTSDAKDSCETDLLRSVDNCGACGVVCPKVNGTASCNAGECEVACDPGFADCDGSVKNGCEVDTTKNVDHCGGCGKVCPDVGGTPSCAAGKCGVSKCDVGFGNCDGDPKTGCEANFANDANNCGACGKACVAANGKGKCVGGECAVDTCDEGFADCDGDYTTGCETTTNTDAKNCGACKNACSYKNAAGVCKAGVCGLGDCNPGFADCDGLADTGCEANTQDDKKNCGACKTVCGDVHGSGSCVAGACTFQCNPGWEHCSALPAFGCDTQVLQDLNNCGACGNVCSVKNGSPMCQAKNCGILSCSAGFKDCDGLYATGCEAALLTDVNNCGTCGKKCTNPNGNATCNNGVCSASCSAGSADCDKNPDNGCEVSTKDDVANCGACGKICGKQNTTTSACSNGSCNIACAPGFSDCDGLTEDGCESSTATDVNNCGGCNVKCTNANGSTSCGNGKCLPICNAGTKDCDNNANNGCEANTKTDANNCGGCGIVCPANQPQCVNSVCIGDCPLDSYEPNNTTWWPSPPPPGPNQKTLDPNAGSNFWPLSGRTSAFTSGMTNDADVDVFWAKFTDDLQDAKNIGFEIKLLNVPTGATYSVTAHVYCQTGDQQDMGIYNYQVNPHCDPAAANTDWTNSWFSCQRDAPAPGTTLGFGIGCTVGTNNPPTYVNDTMGWIEIEVHQVTPPSSPVCSSYTVQLKTYSL